LLSRRPIGTTKSEEGERNSRGPTSDLGGGKKKKKGQLEEYSWRIMLRSLRGESGNAMKGVWLLFDQ